jgi:hypothetical protein
MTDTLRTWFSLINTTPLTFKVEATRNECKMVVPLFLEVDMVLTLVSGKWPLGDYTDCNGRHTFVFQKPDGKQFSMKLDGFTYDCSHPLVTQQGNIVEHNYPGISLSINGTIYDGSPYNHLGDSNNTGGASNTGED